MTRMYNTRLVGILAAIASIGMMFLPAWSSAGPLRATVPLSAVGPISTFGLTDGYAPIYVETPAGLFRSMIAPYSRWTRVSGRRDITLLSPRPNNADDLLFATKHGVYRSVDGGRTATLVIPGEHDIMRAPNSPSVVYVGLDGGLARSEDDGRHWTVFKQPADPGTPPIAVGPIDPGNPHHLLGPGTVYTAPNNNWIYGQIYQSFNGGKTWVLAYQEGSSDPLGGVLGFSPVAPYTIYASWDGPTFWPTATENGLDWAPADITHLPKGSPPTGLLFNPRTGEMYGAYRILRYPKNCGTELYALSTHAKSRRIFKRILGAHSCDDLKELDITRDGQLIVAAYHLAHQQFVGKPLAIYQLPSGLD